METIEIYKTNRTKEDFNIYRFQKILKALHPKIKDPNINILSKFAENAYLKLKEFDENTDKYTKLRNILRQQNIAADFLENTSTKVQDIIQTDVIILGTKYNWPRYTNVVISKLHNLNYNFANLDNYDKLLQEQKLAYEIEKFTENQYSMIPFTVDKIISKSELQTDTAPMDISLLNDIIIYVKKAFNIDLTTTNYYYLAKQLESLELYDALIYCLHGNKKEIKELFKSRILEEGYIIMAKQQFNKMLESLTHFNAAVNIIENEIDESAKILKLIKDKNIKTVDLLFQNLDKKTVTKIKKIIGTRLQYIYAKPCSHTLLVRTFLNGRKSLLNKILDICEKNDNDNQYYCKKCSEITFCQHHLDFMDAKNKLELVNNYKSMELSAGKYSYCKYCNEIIYKNETEFILTSATYENLLKTKESLIAKDTDTPIFEVGLYKGISLSLHCFHFDYDFSQKALLLTIKNIIYYLVYEELAKLKLENDNKQYEMLTSLYGFLFSAIYLMPLFLSDKKISTKKNTPKNPKSYASFFNDEAKTKFLKYTNTEKNKNIMKLAYFKLHESGVKLHTINYKTDKDNLVDVFENPLFLFLHNMYCASHPGSSILESCKNIITIPKPTVTTFLENAKVHTKNLSNIELMVYEHLLDYKSNKCYIYKLSENEYNFLPSGTDNSLIYNPELYEKISQHCHGVYDDLKIKQFKQLVRLAKNKQFSTAYGANFIYDEEGDIINWQHDIEKKEYFHVTKSGKNIKISSIKKHVDGNTKNLVEKRNAKIGFKESKLKKMDKPKDIIVAFEKKSNFQFNQKLLTILRTINQNYTNYVLQYIGRSENKNYAELTRNILPNVEEYVSGSYKVNYYIQLMIEKYYTLKNSPTEEENNTYFEKEKIDADKLFNFASSLPFLDTENYYSNFGTYASTWPEDKFYFWNVETLAIFTKNIMDANKLGILFLEKFYKKIIKLEKKMSMPEKHKILSNSNQIDNIDDTEYNEVDDVKQKLDNYDIIDYEQDEDDINDR